MVYRNSLFFFVLPTHRLKDLHLGIAASMPQSVEEVVRVEIPCCLDEGESATCRSYLICGDSKVLYDRAWREKQRDENNELLSCFRACNCTHTLRQGTKPHSKPCPCWCHEQVINVTKSYRLPRFAKFWKSQIQYFKQHLRAFEEDSMPASVQNAVNMAKTAVWYASFMFIQFHRQQKGHFTGPAHSQHPPEQFIAVHCRNSRSRSPTIILVFFYLFHYMWYLTQLEKGQSICDHLGDIFRTQRPDIASRSVEFPNFSKIWPHISMVILKELRGDSSGCGWLVPLITDVCHAFNRWCDNENSSQHNDCSSRSGDDTMQEQFHPISIELVVQPIRRLEICLKTCSVDCVATCERCGMWRSSQCPARRRTNRQCKSPAQVATPALTTKKKTKSLQKKINHCNNANDSQRSAGFANSTSDSVQLKPILAKRKCGTSANADLFKNCEELPRAKKYFIQLQNCDSSDSGDTEKGIGNGDSDERDDSNSDSPCDAEEEESGIHEPVCVVCGAAETACTCRCGTCGIGDDAPENPIMFCEGGKGCSVVSHMSCAGFAKEPAKFLCVVCAETRHGGDSGI